MTTLKVMAVGDISLQTRNNKHPFENVKEVFKSKDILFGNLETVLSHEGKKAKKAVLLYSSPKNVKYLKDVDFDALNAANNHILDLGVEGFRETLDMLDKNRLKFIGANNDKSNSNHLILKRNGVKLGFLGYTIGRFKVPEGISINKLKEKKIIADIEAIKDKCDFVIVSLHWGTENVFYPSPKQIGLAHDLIDHGATLILGHHPHVIQGIEEYKNGLIAYSLGNFQFDPIVSQSKTNKSIVLCMDFGEETIKNYEIIPVAINRDFLPTVVKGQAKNEMLRFISEISKRVSNGEVTSKWWFEEIAGEYLSGNMRSYVIRIKRYGVMPIIECGIWLITPFCIRCYLGIVRIIWRKHFRHFR
jgi:poly-gamma-glutamate synthesis protein (capsule biosynthesis protein)